MTAIVDYCHQIWKASEVSDKAGRRKEARQGAAGDPEVPEIRGVVVHISLMAGTSYWIATPI